MKKKSFLTISETIRVMENLNQSGFSGRPSVAITDPLTGTMAIHGATNNRPKAYIGEIIDCPWDVPKNIILKTGSAYITVNDFPALSAESLKKKPFSTDLQNLYQITFARGECQIVIYSHRHDAHWNTLTRKEKTDVVKLWSISTKHSRQIPGCVFTEIFENDGPTNTMRHPHGQQYNFAELPPAIQNEIYRCTIFNKKTGKNLLREIYKAEIQTVKRIITRNNSFIAFIPPAAKWPYQIRILPVRSHTLWLTDFSEKELTDLADILTIVRKGYQKFFSHHYQPTIMMTVQQAPFDKTGRFYRNIYGFRIEFYNTALSPQAEKLMFSIENSTGYTLYSDTAEEAAEKLRACMN